MIRAGRVLAARRTAPAATAGGWEFPGGKVDPGETEIEAGVREIAEELGCEASLGRRLSAESTLPNGAVLRVYLGRIVFGEVGPTEHDAVRWLAADELREVAWLPADEPFLAELEQVLAEPAGDPAPVVAPTAAAHFDEGEDAEQVAGTLREEGHTVRLARESFAGEDDSEDRAWLVHVEDPVAARRLSELVGAIELAWMVDDEPQPGGRAPAPLPDGPKRIKRPR
ncbi:UNVERIFIED_CONTAM: hypothetical protein LK11_45670 [Mumia flava]